MTHSLRTRWQHRRLAALGIAASVAVLTAVAAGQGPATAGPTPGGHETRPFEPGADDAGPNIPAPKSHSPSRVPAANVPRVTGLPVTGATGVGTPVDGLNFKDQRNANNGNSFSLEPPDQGLCVGNGIVIEGVNNVFSTYSTAGGASTSGPQSYDPFWNGADVKEIDRTVTPPTYGPFVSDPKCYYDPQLGQFFMTELQLGTDPVTGEFTGDSFVNIAVSKPGTTPTTASSDWYMYRLNVRNDGSQGTPSHTGCPCLGDQPLIGADQYGFYITTNEFPIFKGGFNGAQIYAFDKTELAKGVGVIGDTRTLKVQRIESNGLPLAEGTAYSVQPATSPTENQWSTDAKGTEYFLSALEFTGGFDNRIAAWSLTNTSSLATATPNVHLTNTVIGSEVYGVPPAAEQAKGPTPLADAIKAKENLINSNDDRMNQVVYSDGRLWSGLNTAVKTEQRHPTAGIAYFVVRPSADATTGVSAAMDHQGYVAATGASTIFPSIGVTEGGTGVMTFTLTGNRYYPTSAVVHLDRSGAVSSGIQVLAAGKVPADGFTGYPAFGGNGIERWGDYSAAVADSSGNVWVASEYIPGTFGFNSPDRAYLANWGTYVASVTP